MTTFGMNGMYEIDLAGEALDLDGATVDPSADPDAEHLDSDGPPVGAADGPDAARRRPTARPRRAAASSGRPLHGGDRGAEPDSPDFMIDVWRRGASGSGGHGGHAGPTGRPAGPATSAAVQLNDGAPMPWPVSGWKYSKWPERRISASTAVRSVAASSHQPVGPHPTPQQPVDVDPDRSPPVPQRIEIGGRPVVTRQRHPGRSRGRTAPTGRLDHDRRDLGSGQSGQDQRHQPADAPRRTQPAGPHVAGAEHARSPGRTGGRAMASVICCGAGPVRLRVGADHLGDLRQRHLRRRQASR